MLVWSPDLKIGVIFATFKESGKDPWAIDDLHILKRISFKALKESIMMFPLIQSAPIALFRFSDLNAVSN